MPRNATQSRRQPEPSRVPAWVWLFTGAVLGAFIMFLTHLSEIGPKSSQAPAEIRPESQREPRQTPRFDFYDLLKESEVAVPTPTPAPKLEDGAAVPSDEFILQVASFQSISDADALRAQLILLNLKAYTEQAKIRNGETWHRVMVGPFTSRSKLAKARSILLTNRHEALVLKRQPRG